MMGVKKVLLSANIPTIMEERYYPDGIYDFKALVSGKYFFVDKTLMIRDICNLQNKTLLYTRPRRFGKTVNISMIDRYFNIQYAGEDDIFKGLKIDGCPQCKIHKNAYPVVRMNFGDLKSGSLEEFNRSLSRMVSNAMRPFIGLINQGIIEDDADFIRKSSKSNLERIDLEGSIRKLCSILSEHYGKDVIVLLDEYDACIQNIRTEERFEEIVNSLRPLMEQTFKFNEHLHLGIVTGIMPLAKTSMLSSFNNASVCSILETDGDEFFGFTEDEVRKLLEETGNLPEKMVEIKEWYDGYRFGEADVFNPYSVVMYLKSGCEPLAYWNNMTGGGMSADLISSMGAESLSVLKSLYEKKGSSTLTVINTRISYVDIMSPSADPSVVYSYLSMAGYLKAIRTGEQRFGMPECRVSMVNREVSFAFESLVNRATLVERRAVAAMDAIYNLDSVTLEKHLMTMLSGIPMDHTWSQDDDPTARHNKYRDLIMAYLVTPENIAGGEMPKGYGYTDIFFGRTREHPPVIMEIKTTVDKSRNLDSLADEALQQIDRKGYSDEPDTSDAICIGIAIRMKNVRAKFL